MRDLKLDNITDLASASLASLPDARQRLLMQRLVLHLHAYAKQVNLSHAEWRVALAFLHRAADISSDARSEFSLLSDVLGLSSLVDLLASKPDATNGLYWQIDPAQPRHNLRCQLKVDAHGRWEVATIRARPYEIPTDGPVWHDVVAPAGRTAWRAAHVHLIISAPGHRTLVTEIFDGEDPYLDTDAVFGVREALIGRYCTETDAAAAARLGLAGDQCLVMHTDLVLSPLT